MISQLDSVISCFRQRLERKQIGMRFPTPHLTQDTDELLVEGVQDDVPNVMPPSEEPMTDNNSLMPLLL